MPMHSVRSSHRRPAFAGAMTNSGRLTGQRDLAGTIVRDAARRYIANRRERVDAFVDRHFTLAGSLALHRHAMGWDLLRAPVNLFLTVPALAAKFASRAARRAGHERLAARLAGRRFMFETDLACEIEWLVATELLEIPCVQRDRASLRDALAETVLADPRVVERLVTPPRIPRSAFRGDRELQGFAGGDGRDRDRGARDRPRRSGREADYPRSGDIGLGDRHHDRATDGDRRLSARRRSRRAVVRLVSGRRRSRPARRHDRRRRDRRCAARRLLRDRDGSCEAPPRSAPAPAFPAARGTRTRAVQRERRERHAFATTMSRG